MLDLFHINSTPRYNEQYFVGSNTSGQYTYPTWQKPRGVNWVYILIVGGGGSGGTCTAATSSAGGGGGGSGGQASVLIASSRLPETLFLALGPGGLGPSAATTSGAAGSTSYVMVSDYSDVSVSGWGIIAQASGGAGGIANSSTAAAGGAASITQGMQRLYITGTALTGHTGGQGNIAVLPPTTGLMVTGGTGGGPGGSVAGPGGQFSVVTQAFPGPYFPPTAMFAPAAVVGIPAGDGGSGPILPFKLMNYGGLGGGGASATSGGLAGAGGEGSPGCGGGGSGGATLVNSTIRKAGNGGPGFCYILSW